MTVAVCFNCGSIKWGAFSTCDKCSVTPQTEDDFVLSLAITDHYFDKEHLEQIGADIARGIPVHLQPQTHENLLQMIRSMPCPRKVYHIQS